MEVSNVTQNSADVSWSAATDDNEIDGYTYIETAPLSGKFQLTSDRSLMKVSVLTRSTRIMFALLTIPVI
ncbi:MAG: hypothetical protein U5L95_03210 [Candidatus Saccharibacteria bacterium]|nr:hypothetical protein [Candidatus Saccharibacteria bacterium]